MEKDDYKVSYDLYNQGYNIYLINEILQDVDMIVKFISISKNIKININKINNNIGKNVLLSILNWENSSLLWFTATLFGNNMSNNIFKNVKSVQYEKIYFLYK